MPVLTGLVFVASLAILGTSSAVLAAESPAVTPVVHDELNRALDDLAGQVHGLGDRWRDHFGRGESPAERPLITLMLNWRQELALSPAQVQSLERLRSDFQREATRRDADLRAAETALGTMLQAESVDLAGVETKLREVERQRADLRLARIKTIEQGKTQLTPEQRAKLSTLMASSAPRRAGAPTTFGIQPR
jgi:Spy/CpxP family protein refolding chaperone